MPNDWTTTEADALPWGEVVEVRWQYDPNHIARYEPARYDPFGTVKGDVMWKKEGSYSYSGINGTEWRRIDDGR